MDSSTRSKISGHYGMRFWTLLAMLAVAVPALAREPPELRAREQFRAGQKAYSAGKYEEALTAFSEAYGLQPAPGLLFNIGQCHRQLGNFERAAVFYQQYLDLSPSRENAATVRALLTQVQASEKEQKRLAELEARARAARLQPAVGGRNSLDGSIARVGLRGEVAQPGVSSNSIFKKWWFWAGVGAIAAGTTAYLLAHQHSPDATLGTVNTR